MSASATLAALLVFSFVNSVTPGPNNLMLLASGVNFGFRRTIPHMLGIGCGFMVMTALVGVGLSQVFERFPIAYLALKVAGAGYMVWLAWKIATSGPVGEGTSRGKPMTFLQAAAFQWVNPKAWMMVVTAVSTYSITDSVVVNALTIALVFGIVNPPSISVWVLFGTAMQRWLRDPVRLRLFNGCMAAALIVSLIPMLLDGKP
ncbi:MAG TPA: LysE family translocator [Beijerinckiaceae bacterium]|nr:LysE family translocator [Beijerinckiaceae bacterium]